MHRAGTEGLKSYQDLCRSYAHIFLRILNNFGNKHIFKIPKKKKKSRLNLHSVLQTPYIP